jgi:hypothetical protein
MTHRIGILALLSAASVLGQTLSITDGGNTYTGMTGTVVGVYGVCKHHPEVCLPRCSVSEKELGLLIGDGWFVIPQSWQNVSTVALRITYVKDPGSKEIERCISQLSSSKSTQEYFRQWISGPRRAPIERLWEIWVEGKLCCFVGRPE